MTDWLYRSSPTRKSPWRPGVCGRCPRRWYPSLTTGRVWPVVLYVPLAGWIFWRHGKRRYQRTGSDRADFKGWVQLFLLPDAYFARLLHYVRDAGTALFSDVRWRGAPFRWSIPSTPRCFDCLLVAARFTGGQPPLVERCGSRTEFAVLALTVATTPVWNPRSNRR